MELQVVGAWAPYPRTGEACSGYLLKQDETVCLLDCGHGVMSSLGQYTDPYDINLVIISHFHPDHYVDLHALRHLIRAGLASGRISGPVDLYIPDQPRSQWEYWQATEEFKVYPIRPGTAASYPGLSIDFYPASHPLPTYAVKCSAGAASFFYSADSAAFDDMWHHARGVDILLGEASLLAKDAGLSRDLGHMTTHDLARGALKAQPGLLVATHLWPGFDAGTIAGEIQAVYSGPAVTAHAGLTLSI